MLPLEKKQFQITEVKDFEWDNLLGSIGNSSVFHESWWCRSVENGLGGEFFPIAVHSCGYGTVLCPVFVGKPWAGKGGFRIGAVGYGGPVFLNMQKIIQKVEDITFTIIKLLEEYIGARCIAFCLSPDPFWEKSSFQCSYTQSVVLPENSGLYFNEIASGNVRTAVRKALKSKIFVKELESEDLLTALKLLNTTQELVNASYATSELFFKTIFETPPHQRSFLGGFYKDKMLSMGVYLHGTKETFHLFNGWQREKKNLCANQLVLWEGIKKAIELKAERFNFGESHSELLKKAKFRWGASSIPFVRFNK